MLTAADERAAAKVRNLWEDFRKKNPGISQEEAALRADMSQSAFSQFLLGRVPMRVKPVIKLANLFGVSPTEIRDDLPELVYAARTNVTRLDAREPGQRDKGTKAKLSEGERLLVLLRTFLDTDDDGREELYALAVEIGHVDDESTGRAHKRVAKGRRGR